jgi:outer membrane protein, heavy metal efflux system
MERLKWRLCSGVLPVICAFGAWAQTSSSGLSWEQVRAKFLAANPNLKAGELNIEESKAQEITAYLRPNPDFTATLDQIEPFNGNPYRPFGFALPLFAVSYLHERQHKRELRLASAQQGTAMAETQLQDVERTLLFNLRAAFVQVLEAKALLENAKENLEYFQKQAGINRERLKAGDIARVDLDRVLLQRVQYESDYQNAQVNMRTAKLTLLMLLNDRTPVDRFDVTGSYKFSESLMPLEEYHEQALASRPDLKSATLAVRKAETDHKLAVANGSTDPTFGVDVGRNPPIPAYLGVSVSVPVRIFDRNQGEKARTQIDILHAQRQRDAAEAQVFNDVDSAYFTLVSTLNQLRSYAGPEGYLESAARIRETISFSFQHGQAALLDYLDAQRDYRSTQVAYLTLIGSYLTAAGQLNLAVGREVMQ